jgi:hypothetical protein
VKSVRARATAREEHAPLNRRVVWTATSAKMRWPAACSRGGVLLRTSVLLFVAAWVFVGCDASSNSSSGDSMPVAPTCHRIFDYPVACSDCVEEHCCEEAAACAADFNCKECVQSPANGICPQPQTAAPFTRCIEAHCVTVCPAPDVAIFADADCHAPAKSSSGGACGAVGSPNQCNPVTNDGCDADAGAACDVSDVTATGTGFTCFPSENIHELCEPCLYGGDACRPGMTCVGRCARYCCDDSDCGSAGECDKKYIFDLYFGHPPAPVGVCLKRK